MKIMTNSLSYYRILCSNILNDDEYTNELNELEELDLKFKDCNEQKINEILSYLEWSKNLILQPNLNFHFKSADLQKILSSNQIDNIHWSKCGFVTRVQWDIADKQAWYSSILKTNVLNLKPNWLDWLSIVLLKNNINPIQIRKYISSSQIDKEIPDKYKWIKFINIFVEFNVDKDITVYKINQYLTHFGSVEEAVKVLESWFKYTIDATVFYTKNIILNVDLNFNHLVCYLIDNKNINTEDIGLKEAICKSIEKAIVSFYYIKLLKNEIIEKIVFPASVAIFLNNWLKSNKLNHFFENSDNANVKEYTARANMLAMAANKHINLGMNLFELVKTKIKNNIIEKSMSKADKSIFRLLMHLINTNPATFIIKALDKKYPKIYGRKMSKRDKASIRIANNLFVKLYQTLIVHTDCYNLDIREYMDCIKVIARYFYCRSKRSLSVNKLFQLVKNKLLEFENDAPVIAGKKDYSNIDKYPGTKSVLSKICRKDKSIRKSLYLLINNINFSSILSPSGRNEGSDVFKLNTKRFKDEKTNLHNSFNTFSGIYNFVYNFINVLDQFYCHLVLKNILKNIVTKFKGEDFTNQLIEKLFTTESNVLKLFDLPTITDIQKYKYEIEKLNMMSSLASGIKNSSASLVSSIGHNLKELNKNIIYNSDLHYMQYIIWNLIKMFNLHLAATVEYLHKSLLSYFVNKNVISKIHLSIISKQKKRFEYENKKDQKVQ